MCFISVAPAEEVRDGNPEDSCDSESQKHARFAAAFDVDDGLTADLDFSRQGLLRKARSLSIFAHRRCLCGHACSVRSVSAAVKFCLQGQLYNTVYVEPAYAGH